MTATGVIVTSPDAKLGSAQAEIAHIGWGVSMPERLKEAASRDSACKGSALRVAPRRLAAGLFAAAMLFLAQNAAAESPQGTPKWDPWAELGGYWGSDDSSRGVGELWAPLLQGPTALLFFDGRFQLFEEDVREGNAALGLRKMPPSGWNVGAWVSGDVREEALSVNWDLRINGYLPTTDPQASPSTAEVELKGNNIFMIGGEEVALHGFDGEVGYLLFGSPQTKPGTRHELRVYGGGFWFDASDAIHEVAGPKARIEWRIDDVIANWAGSRLTFETEYSNDDVRDDCWEVGLRLRIPFGGKERAYAGLTPQERRMTERIYRDDDIVTVESGPEKVFDTLTGVVFERVAYVNPSITEVSAEAGDNSLLIVNGTVSGPQLLQGNQTLQGGGSTIQVTGKKSGVTANFTAPGPKAVLVNPGLVPNLLLLGSNTDVAGLDIRGTGGLFGNPAGISGPGPLDNIVIQQTSITDTGDIAAVIVFGANSNANNVKISNSTITDTGGDGIRFLDNNSNVTIENAMVVNTGLSGIGFNLNGIRFGSGNSNVTIANTTVTNAARDGIHFEENNTGVTISGTTITDVLNGVLFFQGNDNVTINSSTITNTATEGIEFGALNSNVTIANTTIANAGGAGIVFELFNSNVTIANWRSPMQAALAFPSSTTTAT
jgi:hypothetical protein